VWAVRREPLLEAVRILNMVGSASGIPSSDFFLLEPSKSGVKLTVSATAVAEAFVLGGEQEWVTKRPFYVARGTFTPFVNVATEIKNKKPFEFSLKQKSLHVEHGPSRYEDFLPQPTIMGYGSLPAFKKKPSQLTFSPELVELMQCAATCAAAEMQSPVLSCLYLVPTSNGVKVYATNLKVTFVGWLRTNIGEVTEPIPFPMSMVGVVGQKGLMNLKWADKCVVARFPTGRIWQTLSEEAATEFPVQEIRDAIKVGTDELNVFTVSAFRFAKLVARLTRYLESVRKEDWVVSVSSKKNAPGLQVILNVPGGKIRETIRTMTPVTRDFQFDWPLNLIAPVLQFIGKESEDLPLTVGLAEDQMFSYVRAGNISMAIPSKSV